MKFQWWVLIDKLLVLAEVAILGYMGYWLLQYMGCMP